MLTFLTKFFGKLSKVILPIIFSDIFGSEADVLLSLITLVHQNKQANV